MPLDMKFWKNLTLRIFFKPHVGKQFLRASNIFMKKKNKLGHFFSPLSDFVICALCFVLCHVICWGEIFHAPMFQMRPCTCPPSRRGRSGSSLPTAMCWAWRGSGGGKSRGGPSARQCASPTMSPTLGTCFRVPARLRPWEGLSGGENHSPPPGAHRGAP